MNREELVAEIVRFASEEEGNFVPAEEAIRPELAGMKIYDPALVGFAAAEDGLFTGEFKKEGVIHPEYLAPAEWLPGAKTVISFFLPFTEQVRASNLHKFDEPYAPGIPQRASVEWLHARIEGQMFLEQVCAHIEKLLTAEGFACITPASCGTLRLITPYISTWSERHAAYAAGLGTFGLSRGLITEKGMAGRFGSVITTAEFEPTPRPYSGPFEYCNLCGACMKTCPVDAIDKARGHALGKDQLICGPYNKGSWLPPHGPSGRVRYGCGKCQCGVPCESGIPGRK